MNRGSTLPHANEGACLCGNVRFEIAGPYRWFAYCHCSMCRKQSGALFGTSLGVPERRIRWLSGEHDVERYRASPAFERPFCPRCGSKTPARSHEEDSWTVPAGLVGGELGYRPRSHIFVAAKSSLADIEDLLPRHAAYPRGIALPSIALAPRARGVAPLEGSCLCGAVAFSADARPREIVHCHCAQCRASTGTAFSSFIAVSAATFRWTSGETRVRRFSSGGEHAAFCDTCGSGAPVLAEDGAVMRLPAGTLDTELGPLPANHLCIDRKAPWYEPAGARAARARRIRRPLRGRRDG
jgi:hypothetical protein